MITTTLKEVKKLFVSSRTTLNEHVLKFMKTLFYRFKDYFVFLITLYLRSE